VIVILDQHLLSSVTQILVKKNEIVKQPQSDNDVKKKSLFWQWTSTTETRRSGFYPYTWWAQLAPSEKQGENLVKIADQNYFSFFPSF